MKKKRVNAQSVEMTPSELANDLEKEENEPPVKVKKRNREKVAYHPVKLSRSDLYRAPTVEELNQLKEAESLFHCSLLKMQMEELLKEIALSERRKLLIDAFVEMVTKLLKTVPRSPDVEVNDLSWLSNDVKVPILLLPKTQKSKFHIAPPASVDLIGSYPLGTCTKPRVVVDLAVTIPAGILHNKDFLNQRYPRKKAIYLAGLAQYLRASSDIGSMSYSCLHGNRLRPILLLSPPGKDSSALMVRLHACPPPGFFKPKRFHPQVNNIRTGWYTGVNNTHSEISEPPTPHYNSTLLGDLLPRAHLQFLSAVSIQCSAFPDGVALLKVWLRQRELDQGTGCFNGFLASMLLAYLLMMHRISNNMTAYQLLRNTLNFLALTDMTVNGISLAKEPDSTAPSLADFHDAFQVVFIDPSGHLNMCADMTACTYKQLQQEASVSMQFWDDPTVDGFHSLLMTPKSMMRTSDYVFQLCELAKLQASCKKLNLLSELMDHSGNYVHTALPFILSLLQRGLGQRISLLTHSLSPDPEWSLESEPPKHKAQPPLTFGLLLWPELATSVLERGPPADSPKAADFRQLWGTRSELRRFQDGAITEAVLWQGDSMCQKRLVPQQIITYLLQLHADIPESCVRQVGAIVEDVIKMRSQVPSTGEEESLRVVQSYDDLSRKLWKLEGLPLSITSVQGAHPSLRYTQVFPPIPLKFDYSFFDKAKAFQLLVPKEGKPCPAYVNPITVICHMEGSGKWPHDRLAIHHIRAAFHIRLGELLKMQHDYTCKPCATHLDVWKDGFVFRIQVAYHREPQILRESVSPEGLLVVRDNEEALSLEMSTIHKPLLTSTLHGLQQQHPCFGAVCRLAKRWLGAQLFSEDITEDTADLLVASLFLQPAPFPPPGSPQVGFLRFLHLLSFFDWRNNPLVVNFNKQLTVADYTEIKNDFMASREYLPVMFIATPRDKKLSMWTKRAPTVQDAFGDLALFFCDPYGGSVIAVLWKPKAFAPLPFKTSQLSARSVKETGEEANTVPNVEAILEDFSIIGKDLVKSVEARTERWSF
ncbi:nucleolar protein 6 [Phyllopteryx taeniolatus]|uniref:nucleolar protein 6 n=1 Tax=Phyllopteryx taeniolatus TaxID=161469 RepID=UPI002AD22C22|nr:nucleolar protein 6 [Phyllopteryx taeniolatus]